MSKVGTVDFYSGPFRKLSPREWTEEARRRYKPTPYSAWYGDTTAWMTYCFANEEV